MPNAPFFGYNSYNQFQNSLSLEAYLEMQNKILEIEKKISILEQEISTLKNKQNGNIYEYQTSMNMM